MMRSRPRPLTLRPPRWLPLLFRDEYEAREVIRVSTACEPPFELEGSATSHALINSASVVVGIDDKNERVKQTKLGYRLLRTILGDQMPERFRCAECSTFGLQPLLKAERRVHDLRRRLAFPQSVSLRVGNLAAVLDVMVLD